MKLLILSCVRIYSDKRILQECKKRKWSYYFCQPKDINIIHNKGKFHFYLKGKEITFDLCYIKRSQPQAMTCFHIGHACAQEGIPTIEEYQQYATNSSKLTEYMSLYKDMPLPETSFLRDMKTTRAFLTKAKFPLLTKPHDGRFGEGVMKLENKRAALKFAKTFFKHTEEPLMLQPFLDIVAEYRALTIDEKIVAICKKIKPTDQIVANYAQGAEFVAADLSDKDKELIIKAVKASQIKIGGVDFAITRNNKRYIFEINRNPNFQGVEEAHPHINVASLICDYLEKQIHKK